MTEGQKYLLKLYKEVDEICKKNNIRYYLAGGTLIGAVRHRGFVPWDDDFDLYMTRDEFNKFIAVAKKGGLPENRVLECQELNRTYRNVFARYTDISTSAIHKNQLISDDVAGEVLDILQLDPVPNNPQVQKKHFKRLMLYADLINPSVGYSSRCGWNKFYYPIYKKMMDICGKDRVLSGIEKKLFKYKEEECDTYVMRWSGAPLIFKKDLFEPALTMPFEGVDSTIPKGFNEYLVDHYGDDWIFIPKVDQQMSHEAVHSLNHDYKLIRESYEPYIEKEKILKQYEKRKMNILFSVKRSHKVADRIVALRGERLRVELLDKISKEKISVEQWYREGKYSSIQKFFNTYYVMQGSAQFTGRDTFKDFYRFQNPILIDLPLEILWPVLSVQHETGKTGKVNRVLEIYRQVKGKLPAELQELKDAIDLQRKAVNLYSFQKYNEALEIAQGLLKEYPRNSSLIKLLVRTMFRLQEDEKKIKNLISKGRELCPEDGEFIKYDADLLFEKNREKACIQYLDARKKTSNGSVLMEIADNIDLYVKELFLKMENCLQGGEYAEATRYYEKIRFFANTPEADIRYFSGMIHEGISRDEAVQIFNWASEAAEVVETEAVEKLMLRALAHCGEAPFIAVPHIKILKLYKGISERIEETYKDIEKRQNIASRNNWQDYERALKKLLADLKKYEGYIKEAYDLYREVVDQLEDFPVLEKELTDMYEADIHNLNELWGKSLVGRKNVIDNLSIKFASMEMFDEISKKLMLKNSLDSDIREEMRRNRE